ncbi:hypothetical protein DSM106972_025270 [Dulcicalothrix desertica PCC 7102]|uniref:Uncharacterized protein n=1 Tax=Dulcicalothrix desertica PCC 7102 TaxID=232991 RepID=A0A3S1J433_9CYAN|nr:hypothetical protein [Dulcicalothrix desertica]RUT07266.1 hypothetical protein DSM106972_025270 [Dulcicalothrix desertica PCC 7102]TWH55531.1 hypothetical protein CAL7102_03675 [Dulcicalothrix desertica PCC 7102]
MAIQNEKAQEFINLAFEYIVYLKNELSTVAASDKAKDEVIIQKDNEALQMRQLFDEYVANDMNEDNALVSLFDIAKQELEAKKV